MRIPVTIVGGFLGSGKTTLLRRRFLEAGREGTAVIVNEFGTVGIDHRLLYSAREETVLVGGGCACCARRPDLARALAELLDRAECPERVVIETSGLADPAPIAFTLARDPMLRHHFALERIVVTVDGVLGAAQLEAHAESRQQVHVADELVITKVDQLGERAVAGLAGRLRVLNPRASVRSAAEGVVGADALLAGRPDARPALVPAPAPALVPAGGGGHAPVQTTTLSAGDSLGWVGFTVWLSLLLHAHGEDVLRVKGVLDLGGDGRVLLDAVQHVMSPPRHVDHSPGPSAVVFVTRGLDVDALDRSLAAFQRVAA